MLFTVVDEIVVDSRELVTDVNAVLEDTDSLVKEYVLVAEIVRPTNHVKDTAANIAKYLNDTSSIKVSGAGSIASFSSENGKLIQLTSKAFNNLKTAETSATKNLFDSEIHITGNLEGTADQIVAQVQDIRAKKRANFTLGDFGGTINDENAISVATKKIIAVGLTLSKFTFSVEDDLATIKAAIDGTNDTVVSNAVNLTVNDTK